MTIRVVIADDHRVVRDGLCYLLGQEPDVEVAGEAGDGRQAVDVVAATRPDVLADSDHPAEIQRLASR